MLPGDSQGSVQVEATSQTSISDQQIDGFTQEPKQGRINNYVGRVFIRPQDFDQQESKWSEYGAKYESNEAIKDYGATHTHVYGRSKGKFMYSFVLPKENYLFGVVWARLSSEYPLYGQNTPADGFSEVNIYVNKLFLAKTQVIPDNGSGKVYAISIPKGVLKAGTNSLEFVVGPEGKYCNGLSIYEKSLVDDEPDGRIIIQFSIDAHESNTDH